MMDFGQDVNLASRRSRTVSFYTKIIPYRLMRVTVALLAALLLGSAVAERPIVAQGANARTGREQALRATVLVLVPDNNGDLVAGGSGTIMDADKGYILTNYHVLGDRHVTTLFNKDGLAVIGLMPPNLRGAPVLRYIAKFIGGDPVLDLAVLQVEALFADPQATLPQNLGMTAIARADSDELMIGDNLFVIGYPDLGGNTLTMSTGLVSGFLDEDNDGVFEWIKTDAEMNHGNSGGLATNTRWEFIGVPTAGVSDLETAGRISFIRTGNLALEFYESVLVGNVRSANNGPYIRGVEFGEAVNRHKQVTRPAMRFDSGISGLYATFEFARFSDGLMMDVIWYRDGVQVETDRFAWDEGESGRSWVSLSESDGLTGGLYELELILDGKSIYRGSVTIGDAEQSACAFGEITFAVDVDDEGKPVDPGVRFGNVQVVYGIFPVSGMRNGAPWKTIWYYEGRNVLEDEAVWDLGDVAWQWVSLMHPDGLPEGEFTLELQCNGQPVQRGSFEVIDRPIRQTSGVNVTGVITDRDSKRRKIEGALVVFLQPGATVDAWVDSDFSEIMIFATATSDENGEYQLDAKVQPGERYSVIVLHDHYEPVSENGYTIPVDAGDPYELNLSMARRR